MRSLTRVTTTGNDHFFEFPKPSLTTALTVYHYLDFYGNGYCTLRNEVASKGVRFMRVFLYTFLNTAVNTKSSINRLLSLMLHLSLLYCFLRNNLLFSLFPLFNSYQVASQASSVLVKAINTRILQAGCLVSILQYRLAQYSDL